MLVSDINNIDGYQINAGASMLFLNEAMTEFRLRARDVNGFTSAERKWTLKEVAPPPIQNQYVTREEINNMNDKMDKILNTLAEFMK